MAEFIVRLNNYERHCRDALVVFMVTAMPLMFGFAMLAPITEPFFASIAGDVVAPFLTVAPIVAVLVISACLGGLAKRRLDHRYGVWCPCCGHDLFVSRRIVIATRNCPYCGTTVIQG
ncbi:MAG: hypothetical protein ACYSUM_24430 [Planctomycetota bacterium]